jgi:hypothetical protein
VLPNQRYKITELLKSITSIVYLVATTSVVMGTLYGVVGIGCVEAKLPAFELSIVGFSEVWNTRCQKFVSFNPT